MTSLDRPPPIARRPRYPDGYDDVVAELGARFAATPLYGLLGIAVEGWGPGWARTSLTPTGRMGNLAGTVHGGITFALADAAFEVACNSHGRMAVALETTCHHHLPAAAGAPLVADAWEVSRGGRTASYRLGISDGDGRVVASYLALAYRTSRWHVDPSRLPEGWGEQPAG